MTDYLDMTNAGASAALEEFRDELLDGTPVRDEPGGYDFEIGLADEIAHERSADVDRLVRELSGETGISRVLREDRELILVRAPSWSIDALRTWIAQHI